MNTAAHAGRVSVVMPVYNAAATVEASMRSVLEQSHQDVELVVVDDGSHDDSWERVSRIAANDARVVPLRQANGGVAAARNTGIEAASGEYIAFLDSDDRWAPTKLATQLAWMRQQDARVAYAAYERVDEAGRRLSLVNPPAAVDYRDMLKSNRIGNLTGIYHRSLGDARFRRIGHEDYVFWLEMVRRAGRAVCAPSEQPLAHYLVRAGSLSADKRRAAGWQWRIYREVEGLNVLSAGWYFMHYTVNALRKRR